MSNCENILGAEGRIAARLGKQYEQRPQQLAMATAIENAIRGSRHLIVEAGTGVGKSFAYLVPAILAVTDPEADDNQRPRRIVVSTHTISLQEQLLDKDIPLLGSVIPREFTTVLGKGRRNYLSLRRLGVARSRGGSLLADDGKLDQLRQIRSWSEATSEGSLSDLPFSPSPDVWDEVASDTGNCLGRQCPTYQGCFYYTARRRMQNAQILLVNHALLMSDVALRRLGVKLLPDYDVVICDEAHMLENVASDHLGLRLSSSQVDFTLNRLFNDRSNKGLLVHHRLVELQQFVMHCRFEADRFFGMLEDWREQRAPANGRVAEPIDIENPLSKALTGLAHGVHNARAKFDDKSERQEFTSAGDRLLALAGELELWSGQSQEAAVYWLESQRRRGGFMRTVLGAAPLNVGAALREYFFDPLKCVVLTSATLAVGKDDKFEFLKNRLGLTQADSLRLGSPFDFAKQVTLVTLRDMPDPGSQKSEFETQSVEMIRRYVGRTDGRAFVLCTSFDMIRRLAERLTPWLASQNLALYCQGEGVSRTELLRRFKENPRGVLLGADSFWQGVDVPGDALRTVIIAKLPFSVPDLPLIEARLEEIRRSGGNPFKDYQIPEAVLKFRQGFGRLIRGQQDSGQVVVLDPRIVSRPYGRSFLESLPPCRHVEDEVAERVAPSHQAHSRR